MQKLIAFTIIEILVSIAIAGILILLAIPSFTNHIYEQRVVTHAESLYQFLQSQRSQATKSSKTVYIDFQTGASWCFGANLNSSCTCNVSNSCALSSVQSNNDQTTLATSGIPTTLQFDPTTGSANYNATITIDINNTKSIKAIVSKSGNIKLCSNNVSGYASCT